MRPLKPLTRSLAAIIAVAAALFLVACGGSDEKKTDPAKASGSVEDQLGFTQQRVEAAQVDAEARIATCMKAQGFEYVPVDPVAARASLAGGAGQDLEGEQFGYGIATLYGKGNEQTDPNAKIRRNLSPADLRAYDQALSGGRPDQTFFVAVDTGDFSQLGGCTKQAAELALGGDELLNTVQRLLDDLEESKAQDQRRVRAQEAFQRCMRERTGESYQDSEAVEADVLTRLDAIVGGGLPEGELAPGALASEQPSAGYDQAALARLRELERKLARADRACEEQHIEGVEEVVGKEKERAFREKYAEALRTVKPLGQ